MLLSHTTAQPWQMTGARHGAAIRCHVPGAQYCLQPINQQGRSPGPNPSNPLHRPAGLPDLVVHCLQTLL